MAEAIRKGPRARDLKAMPGFKTLPPPSECKHCQRVARRACLAELRRSVRPRVLGRLHPPNRRGSKIRKKPRSLISV